MLFFGDIFRYEENEFVYLCGADDIIYAARILDEDLSKRILFESEKAASRGKQVDSMPVYCFVILKTQDFKNRAAYFGSPDFSGICSDRKICSLVEDDIASIKKEILASRGVPEKLKELVRQLG